ncbi:MAG: GNAT family N-acetyltransferase [Gemmatimonadaceae bacterium]|nr:GNAT family N-acetyltransferase [Gemmatimonadaceae bacterium]MCW5825952.1 GNAT family N-acetyltransferase [Gemmatimonadaceae bacterium]
MSDVARISGPFAIRPEDIPPLNALFADAFSERYRRDGLAGVRVPPLNPAIWRFAIDGAGAGAMLWRDAAGEIAAFNLAHVLGTEGWMGPLAVREDLQARGLGRQVVEAGAAHLKRAGCRTIGLETMPRTMDNIGFYASMGFLPGPLTITVTLEALSLTPAPPLGHLGSGEREEMLAACAALTDAVRPGADYRRELLATMRQGLGDVVLLRDKSAALRGYALFHDVPLVEGRAREELRVLKLVVAEAADLPALLQAVRAQARRSGALRAALRLQGEYPDALRVLVAQGARVRWTDLRMTLSGFGETPSTRGIALSNWEI